MLALPSDAPVLQRRDDRPGYRPYRAVVARILSVTPHFTRVTFTGPQLDRFGTDGLDQRIKIVLPLEEVGFADFGTDDEESLRAGDWYARWRELPDEQRNPFRTYTVRAVRPADCEIDVDFVAHADDADGALPGPAALWLGTAVVGNEVIIVGPDALSIHSAGGIDFHPGTATEILLAGDETAAPAICSILESLEPGIRARAFIEVPSSSDAMPVTTSADVELTWLARDSDSTTLEQAVRDWVDGNHRIVAPVLSAQRQVLEEIDVDIELLWDSPAEADGNSFYAWLAGESAMIKLLRRYLVSETGIDRSRVAFMGYWRRGKAEAQ
jgi:NADPH-dependent ferric siderophore reductase